ncbi:MAG: DUF3301 domain-containing protein [Gammaproteobacteria bacterium]|nr:DUF3301 domain-containing protein [Gammaproteobacteria bacterium]
MQQLFYLFILFFITAYWIDTVRVKELARQAGKIICKKHDVQFLDNTVVKQQTRIKYHHASLFQLVRHYDFEYSIDGSERKTGVIIMRGQRLGEIQMDLHTYDNQDAL